MNADIKIILESMAIQIENLEKELDDIDNNQINAYCAFDAIKHDFKLLSELLKN